MAIETVIKNDQFLSTVAITKTDIILTTVIE